MHRRAYQNYAEYLRHQIEKTSDPRTVAGCKRKRRRRMKAFRKHFALLRGCDGGRGVCLGARYGEEVQVLRDMGYDGTIGVDLVACEPLVIEADFHHLPFADDSFDFAFSNSLDHAFDLDDLFCEVARVVKPAGVALWHAEINHMHSHESLRIDSVNAIVEAMAGWHFIQKADMPQDVTALLFIKGIW